MFFSQSQQNTDQKQGITIFGLYLDGAAWDEQNECITKSVAGTRPQILPEIHFLPCLVSVVAANLMSCYIFNRVYLFMKFVFNKSNVNIG